MVFVTTLQVCWRSFLVFCTECAVAESRQDRSGTFRNQTMHLACVDDTRGMVLTSLVQLSALTIHWSCLVHSMQLCLSTNMSPMLSGPALSTPGRCVTSGRSLPSRQLRLLLLHQSSSGARLDYCSSSSCWTHIDLWVQQLERNMVCLLI